MIFRMVIIVLLFLLTVYDLEVRSQNNFIYSIQAAPTEKNFTYPQSVFVDSPNGHIWVTDFSNHRVLRFDVSTLSLLNEKVSSQYPGDFFLSQNYPNPFNPTTQISFSLKYNENVLLTVYNILGQKLTTLFDGSVNANTMYSISFDANSLAAGIYIYRLDTKYGSEVKKMCLLK